MKIVHLFWSFTIGGAETMIVDLMKIQSKDYSKIYLIIVNNYYSKKLIETINPQIKIILLNRKNKSVSPIPFIKLILLLLKINPNIIHCHNYNLINFIPKFYHRRTILTVHGFNRPLYRNKSYERIIAISHSIAKDLVNKKNNNIVTIYNGVDHTKIRRKEKFNDVIKITCIGRIDIETKGQDLLLEAIAILKNKYQLEPKLYFIGDGPSKKELIQLSYILKIENQVIFLGNLSRREVYNSLCSFDISVVPSRHEGFGLSAVEAMIAEVPLITSNASGLLEVTNSGENTLVVTDPLPELYAEAIFQLIYKIDTDQYNLKSELNKCRNKCIKKFSIQRMSTQYFSMYKQMKK